MNDEKERFIGIFESAEMRIDAEKRRNETVAKFDDLQFGSVRFINKLKQIVRSNAKSKRKMILKRDKNECRLCGASSAIVDLEMHHIISVDDYVAFLFRQLDKKNVSESIKFVKWYAKRVINHPSNLIMLCQDCHDGLDLSNKFTLFNKTRQRNILWR